jgi:outer membrane protein assembly factor BamB
MARGSARRSPSVRQRLHPRAHLAPLIFHLSSLIVISVAVPPLADAADWPGWRGPHRTGVTEDTGAPTTWSADEGAAWRVELPGQGVSSPVIWGDRVFVTAAEGPRQEELIVLALAAADGRELWRLRLWGTAPTLYNAEKSGMATPTPVTDGEHLFAFFGTGDVFCIDVDGRLVWQRSLADEYGAFENRFAASSSPLLYRDTLIVQCDHYGQSYALALDKATGANRWKADRPECWLSWSSPLVVAVEGEDRDELVLCGSEKIDALDPLTGRPLWTLPGMAHECVPTPVVGGGLLYATSGPNGTTYAIRPGGTGDISGTHVAWSNARGTPFVPSAILVGDYYYVVNDQGIGACLAAGDGRQLWRKRIGGAFTASPVAAEGKVYFVNEEGETLVVAAGVPRYEELARNPLGEPVYASPAISGGRIYVRGVRRLYALGR